MLETETTKGKVTISRKTFYGIAFLVIVVFAGVMIYLFGSSQTSNVKIVRFFLVTEHSWMGRTMGARTTNGQVILPFYVKVENSGSNNVSDLVVVVRVFGGYTELGNDTAHIKTLQAGRRITLSMVVKVNKSELLGKALGYVATVYLDNAIVDEARGER